MLARAPQQASLSTKAGKEWIAKVGSEAIDALSWALRVAKLRHKRMRKILKRARSYDSTYTALAISKERSIRALVAKRTKLQAKVRATLVVGGAYQHEALLTVVLVGYSSQTQAEKMDEYEPDLMTVRSRITDLAYVAHRLPRWLPCRTLTFPLAAFRSNKIRHGLTQDRKLDSLQERFERWRGITLVKEEDFEDEEEKAFQKVSVRKNSQKKGTANHLTACLHCTSCTLSRSASEPSAQPPCWRTLNSRLHQGYCCRG